MSSQIVHVRFYCRRRIAVLGERARRRQGESSQAPQNRFDASRPTSSFLVSWYARASASSGHSNTSHTSGVRQRALCWRSAKRQAKLLEVCFVGIATCCKS